MKLRPYQITLEESGRAAFRDGHRCIAMQAPTGAGKTVTFTSILKGAFDKGNDALLLTDRTELFKQGKATLELGGVSVSTIEPSTKVMPTSGIVVAMAPTLGRRLAKCGFSPKLIIVDEAHIGTFTRVLEHFPDAYVMGFTATPMGKHIPKIYTHIVQGPQVKELIKLGNLCKAKSFQMVDDVGPLKTQAGEFNNSDLFTFYDKPTLYSGVKNTWLKRGECRPTLIFCVNIEHAEKTTEEFGEFARVITSHTQKDDRDRLLKEHREGVFPVLVNCGILTTGFDAPYVSLIVVNRATKSLPLWLQMCGRGSRPTPTKDTFEIWDFGGNFTRHGLWQADREWPLEQVRKKHALGAPPVRKCKCGAMLDASAKECEYCGHVFPVADKTPIEGVLRALFETTELTPISRATVEQIVEAEKTGRIKAAFAWRVCRGRGLLKEYARVKGYKAAWIYRQQQNNSKEYKDISI